MVFTSMHWQQQQYNHNCSPVNRRWSFCVKARVLSVFCRCSGCLGCYLVFPAQSHTCQSVCLLILTCPEANSDHCVCISKYESKGWSYLCLWDGWTVQLFLLNGFAPSISDVRPWVISLWTIFACFFLHCCTYFSICSIKGWPFII